MWLLVPGTDVEVVEAEGVEPSCWSRSNRATTCVVRVLSWSPAPAPADRIMVPATPQLVSSPQPPEVPGHGQPAI